MTGRLPFYPDNVQLTGIDLSTAMLDIARHRAQSIGRTVSLCVGDAQALPLSAACFDTVVITLALCSIPDDRQAVREAYRVLRPGGCLLFLEHVRSPVWPVQIVQRVLAPPACWLMADHLLREPLDYLAEAGFVIDRTERCAWGIVERVVAHKPAY
ncbi:MAG: class I SAM-dependent methyltransferase [Chloroflexota bacterium]|nr:class I SAM-dependent methyltransferase [Chloroflexota bacterium]